jgi:sterol desaturase/sphingolipid hydroxylase (fatty acid hydroxylase superfamily)
MASLPSFDPTQFATPAFILLMVVEGLWLSRHREEGLVGYATKDTAASLTMGTVYSLIYMGWKLVEYGFYSVLYEATPLRMGNGVLAWVLLFFAEDFCYYWFHRVHHESRFFWASHVVHHSSEHYNLSTALRQTWTPMTHTFFWAPLALLGFHPALILTQHAFSLLYQFWIHTETVRTLGPLEGVLNTPSHHRVHHGANARYLDRNYAGILILWDRLFGTFQPEDERPIYGLTKNIHTYNPLRIAFHEYAAIVRDVLRPNPWRVRLGLAFRNPAWKPPEASVPAAGDGAVLRAEEGGGQLPSHPGA